MGGAALHWAVVVIPIASSVIIALANRRAAGKRWVLCAGRPRPSRPSSTASARQRRPTREDTDPRERALRLGQQLATIEGMLVQSDAGNGPLTGL